MGADRRRRRTCRRLPQCVRATGALPSASMAPPSSQLHLLDLPPDVLVAILSRLPFLERLRLSGVCR